MTTTSRFVTKCAVMAVLACAVAACDRRDGGGGHNDNGKDSLSSDAVAQSSFSFTPASAPANAGASIVITRPEEAMSLDLENTPITVDGERCDVQAIEGRSVTCVAKPHAPGKVYVVIQRQDADPIILGQFEYLE